ncbi:permease-like cell division protein FtsX [Actinomadura sp. WAC 06369]|uniref:permease-like cell division protein FtsX n=1 Tax=Actinomadura sp. WAC 06369 TaxID=2203193 RepID=UPI000F79A909|nr:permease-like cell division protein FtsX [Actinomadura sp. WAC 06369]RSN61921.1 hypothetical protein DMH08_20230 [Actinomadura sp. WAC 06369]
MNGTEERLKDALDAVAGTVRPGDVPPPRFAERRRARTFRRVVPMAAAAAIAAAAGGGALAGGALGGTGGTVRPGAASGPSAAAPAEPHLTVFLCVRTSPEPRCGGRDATPEQRREVRRVLSRMDVVARIDYESLREAFERFEKRFAESSDFAGNAEEGDIPASYRVWLRDPGDERRTEQNARIVQDAVRGLPGVEQVVQRDRE